MWLATAESNWEIVRKLPPKFPLICQRL